MAHKNKQNYSPYKARLEKAGINPVQKASNRSFKAEKIYSPEEANDRLADIFRNHDFKCSHEERQKLALFYSVLMQNQEHQNFTRLLKIKDIAIKHFIDSLIITELCDLQFPLLDLGTGPGFPGIPLKIRYPDQKILLAEGVQKRVEFLKTVREKLDLKNLDIIGRNVNEFFVYPVNGVITRAVEDIPNTLRNVLSCLQCGGAVYFMKGPGVDPEFKLIPDELLEFYTLEKDIAYDLKHTENHRRLVIFRKIKNAPLPDDPDEEVE
ncbi:MAG: 16S rRNA (guanine(527)-N(7))-methyltransferase RsmG [Bdellovibrionales bacterium RIFCSPHIGHO2_01_FULL_40_29]|nr:MAG: 16S rRNA (guanine(527)-N(7))-methyltransferase RsmG [Bdellovibrionales bacterium RIFCSPHIGHO2_01_FULL_40_29]OFZ34511.1 MAG: 16S rRNA (guanine(527)-N(7))-methyltransferase RsmG [Bdellovibrionales bacterium RIFCSPHIGHO2_02_FULL_40_15]